MEDLDNVALKPQWLPGSRGKSSLLTSGTSNPLPVEKHGSSGTSFTPLKHPARISANLNASEEVRSNFKKTATVESSSARWNGEARPQLQASEKISTTDLKPLTTNAVLLTNRHAGATRTDLQHIIASSDRDTWRSSPRKTYPHHKTKALSSDEASNEQSFPQSSTACVQGNLTKEDFPTLSANSAASVHPQEATSSSRHHAAFLSSRIPEHWTSRLAEPETVHVAEAPGAALSATKPQSSVCTSRSVVASDERNVKVASRTSVADSCTLPSGSPSSQSTPSVLSSANAWTAVSQPEKINSQLPWEGKEIAISSFPSATASTAAVGAAPSRSSFAQAASSSLLESVVRQSKLGVGSVGPDSSHLSDQQLREKLAVKKSRQLVPLMARKEESSFSSAVSTGLGSSKQKGAVLGGSGVSRWLGGKVQKVVPSASHGSTVVAAAAAAPVVLPLRGVAVAEMLPNGTMMLTKKSSLIPLDRPLTAVRTPSHASATPATCSDEPPRPKRPQPITESTEGGEKLSWMGLQQIADEEKIVGCLGIGQADDQKAGACPDDMGQADDQKAGACPDDMGQADDQKAGACPDDISEGGKNYEEMPFFKGEATSAAWNPFLHSPAPTFSTCMSQQATTFLLNDDSQVIPPPALDCHHLSSHIPPLSLLEALSDYNAKQAITNTSYHSSHLVSPLLLSSHLVDTTCSFSPEPQLSSGGPTQCTSPALPHLSQLPPSNATIHQVLDEGLEFAEMCSLLPCDLLGPALPVVFNAPSSRPLSSPSSVVHKPCMNGELLLSRQSGNGGGCLPRVLESPEEEEEAFLRSMGWMDVEGEQDVALTDEEVAAFMSKAAAPSADKTTQGLSGSLNASLEYDAIIPVRRGLWNDGLTMLRSSSNQVATVARGL